MTGFPTTKSSCAMYFARNYDIDTAAALSRVEQVIKHKREAGYRAVVLTDANGPLGAAGALRLLLLGRGALQGPQAARACNRPAADHQPEDSLACNADTDARVWRDHSDTDGDGDADVDDDADAGARPVRAG